MTADLSRRQFTCFAAAAATCAPLSSWAQPLSATHVFFHQTGGPAISYFFLGALITDAPQQHRDAIDSIRKMAKYDRICTYKSTDKYKYEFCCRLIDYFLGAKNIRFVGGKVQLEAWPDSARNKDIVYFGVHKKLLEVARLKDTPLAIHMVNRGFSPRGATLSRKFRTELPWKANVTWDLAREEPLLQVANFFTGSLQDQSGSQTKDDLLIYLRQSLKVDRLTEPNLRDNQMYRIRQIWA